MLDEIKCRMEHRSMTSPVAHAAAGDEVSPAEKAVAPELFAHEWMQQGLV
jgi:hypothetical protein